MHKLSRLFLFLKNIIIMAFKMQLAEAMSCDNHDVIINGKTPCVTVKRQ